MIRFFTIFFLILTPMIRTYEDTLFLDAVNDNYEYYEITLEEELSSVKIIVVVGINNTKWSISLFFKQLSLHEFQLKTVINNQTNLLTTNTNYGMYYKIEASANEKVTVEILEKQSGNCYDVFDIQIPDNVTSFKAKPTTLTGLNNNKFPVSSVGYDLKDTIIYLIFGFLTLAVLFGLIILFIMKKKKGRFNPAYQQLPIVDYFPQEDSQIVEVKVEPEKSKQEIMDDLFNDFKKGKISEADLNAALRSLWWQNDD